MQRQKSIIIGIICGIGCALCIWAYGNQLNDRVAAERAEAMERYGGDQLEVCVAKRTINPGELLEESAIKHELWLVDLLPDGAITDPNSILGRQVGSPILEGEVISEHRFEHTTNMLEVPQDKTAVSVPAKSVQAVGGSIDVGMIIDVYATGTTTERILQNVPVLAAGLPETDSSFYASASTWLTLAVPPESVGELVAAAQNLELYFTLPGQGVSNGQNSPLR